jgi:hypothetical protein
MGGRIMRASPIPSSSWTVARRDEHHHPYQRHVEGIGTADLTWCNFSTSHFRVGLRKRGYALYDVVLVSRNVSGIVECSWLCRASKPLHHYCHMRLLVVLNTINVCP